MNLCTAQRLKNGGRFNAAVPGVIALLTLAWVLACSAGGARAQVVGAQFDNARLERLRGLNFTKPVPLVAMKGDEAERIFEKDLGREYTDDRLRADGMAGSMVGLFPPQFDLKGEILKAERTQSSGVYSNHLKEIVLVQHRTLLEATNSSLWFSFQSGFLGSRLAHVLTHALQDQHFNLEKWHEKLKNEDDQGTAFKSVAEGDATLAAVAYAADYIDVAVVNRLVSNLDGMTRRINAFSNDYKVPEGLAAPKIFSHAAGIKFVAEAYRRGGWTAVDALYSHPPVSTQQIMNPQLYFDHKMPVEIKLTGYEKVLPAATLVHSDTYGELLLQVILQRNPGEYRSQANLSRRWAGDRMAIIRQGDAITVIWMLAFSDPSSAQQFAAYYSSILDRLHGTATAHLVTYRNNEVLCVAGEGLRGHPELPAEIWKHTRIGPAS